MRAWSDLPQDTSAQPTSRPDRTCDLDGRWTGSEDRRRSAWPRRRRPRLARGLGQPGRSEVRAGDLAVERGVDIECCLDAMCETIDQRGALLDDREARGAEPTSVLRLGRQELALGMSDRPRSPPSPDPRRTYPVRAAHQARPTTARPVPAPAPHQTYRSPPPGADCGPASLSSPVAGRAPPSPTAGATPL
jgi:hypothetical protein